MGDDSRGRSPWPRRIAVVGVAVVAIAAAAAALVTTRRPAPPAGRVVVVELRASAGSLAQLFWASDLAFTPTQVSNALLAPGDSLQRLRFPIPTQGVQWLRLDPTDAAGEVLIERVQILDADGSASTIPLQRFRPGAQIARAVAEAGGLRVTTAPAASDPSLLLSLGCQDGQSVRSAVSTFGGAWLVLMTVAALALVSAGTWAIARSVVGTLAWNQRGLVAPAVWIAALVLVVFGGKLLLMRAIPVMTPFWDQWDGEAAVLFVPYAECSLAWRDMFGFHNEHRIFFSRLLALDLLALNGQWDPRLEQVVNAGMHTLTAALVASMFWLAAGRRRLDLVVVLATLVFALPFAWENSLIGFQSAFYFLLLFSMLAIWLTTSHRVGSVPWLVGWACAACAVFTAASGLLAAVTIGAIWALRAAGDSRERRAAVANIAVALVVFGGGYAVSAPPLAHHEVYRVSSAADYAIAAGRSLAWPWIDRPALAVVAWLPLTAMAVWVLWRRFETTALERFTLGLGLWVGLHAGALAYARGAGGAVPAGRYMDFLSLGFMANGVAVAAIIDRLPSRPMARRIGMVAAGIWTVVGLVGLNGLVRQTWIEVSARRPFHQAHTDNVRQFVLTGNAEAFLAKAPLTELPYPDPRRLLSLLQDPYVRQVLPAAVRAPLPLTRAAASGDAFVPHGLYQVAGDDPLRPAWGSFSRSANAAEGRFQSEPIESCALGGSLAFDVAGHLGFDEHNLAVRDEKTGREKAAVRRGPVRDGWSMATVPCPDGSFTIVADDNSRWSWFAFRPPVEIGGGSIAAERLIEAAWPIFVTGLIVLGLAARWT